MGQTYRFRVLIVEDEAVTALHMAGILQRLGYDVVGMVDTAAAAVSACCRHMPDLVLMDINLKDGNSGIAAARRIRARCKRGVLFVTARADAEALAEAGDADPVGYVMKPFTPPGLARALESALNA